MLPINPTVCDGVDAVDAHPSPYPFLIGSAVPTSKMRDGVCVVRYAVDAVGVCGLIRGVMVPMPWVWIGVVMGVDGALCGVYPL